MGTIPEQLKDMTFCKVWQKGKKRNNGTKTKGKEALGKLNEDGYQYTYDEIQEHLSNWNVGVLCGYNNLLVLDVDDEKFQEEIEDKLPPTFTVRSGGKGLKHFYYKCDDPSTGVKPGVYDLQGLCKNGYPKMVVAPPSKTENHYTVADDLPIATIKREELNRIIGFVPKNVKDKIEKRKKQSDEVTEVIKDSVNITDAIKEMGSDDSYLEERSDGIWTDCPFHDSKSHTSFHIEGQVWYCFGGCGGGDIFDLWSKKHYPDLDDKTAFKKSLADLRKKAGLPEMSYSDEIQQIWQVDGNIREKRLKTAKRLYEIINENERIYSFIDDNKEEFWKYEDGIYTPNGKHRIKRWVYDIMGDYAEEVIVDMVGHRFIAYCGVEMEKFISSPDKYPEHICLKNGILDLNTMQLHDYTPDEVHFGKVNASYDPDADCPHIKEFLNEILSNEDDMKLLQEYIGTVLINDVRYEKALMLYGKRGRNGKGKFLELLQKFFGDDNVKNMQFEHIVSTNFSLSELQGKILNIVSEMGEDIRKHMHTVKYLTGRDTVDAPRKFKSNIKFKPYSNLIFAVNKLPTVFGATNDDAFWHRWLIIEFPYQFMDPINYDENNPYHRKQNAKRIENLFKYSEDGEFDGFLNWAIEGYHRVEKQKKDNKNEGGGFSATMDIKELREYWLRNSSSIIAFLMDKVEASEGDYIRKKALSRAYHEYCIENRLDERNNLTAMRPAIAELFGGEPNRVRDPNGEIGDRVYIWEDIRFKG